MTWGTAPCHTRRMRHFLLPALLLLGACLPIRRNLAVSVPSGDSSAAQFEGISASLDREPLAKLLLIHGMGDHDFTYADRIISSLDRRIGLEPRSCHAQKLEIVAPFDPLQRKSYLTVCDYARKRDGKLLRIYTLLWSGLTRDLKYRNLEYDWTKYRKGRKWLNASVKADIIDKSLSDAVLYAGSSAPLLRYPVSQAICATIRDTYDLSSPCRLVADGVSPQSGADVFIVTHSLGSMMLLETLDEMGKTAPKEIAAFGQDTKLIVMLANQLPLLALAREQSAPPAATALDGGAATLQLRAFFAQRDAIDPLRVVAFSDRNDLLSFPIPDAWQSLFPHMADKVQFVNVLNANAKWALLGVIANPGTAHTGYWNNSMVGHFIADGCREPTCKADNR